MAELTVIGSGGVTLAVFTDGDPAAPPVLLVHGYPDTHAVWDASFDFVRLAEGTISYRWAALEDAFMLELGLPMGIGRALHFLCLLYVASCSVVSIFYRRSAASAMICFDVGLERIRPQSPISLKEPVCVTVNRPTSSAIGIVFPATTTTPLPVPKT